MREINITTHAVEQFIRRWVPDASFEKARRHLHALLRTAKCVAKTIKGDQIYVSSMSPDIRMVIKDRNVCITVLPPIASTHSQFDIEEFTLIAPPTESFGFAPSIEELPKRTQAEQAALLIKQIQDIEKEFIAVSIQHSEVPRDMPGEKCANSLSRKALGLKKSELHNSLQSLLTALLKTDPSKVDVDYTHHRHMTLKKGV